MHLMEEAKEAHRSGILYGVLIFMEHSLGKTRYRSVMGLVIAAVASIFRLLFRRAAPTVDACERKEETDGHEKH